MKEWTDGPKTVLMFHHNLLVDAGLTYPMYTTNKLSHCQSPWNDFLYGTKLWLEATQPNFSKFCFCTKQNSCLKKITLRVAPEEQMAAQPCLGATFLKGMSDPLDPCTTSGGSKMYKAWVSLYSIETIVLCIRPEGRI